MWKLLKKYIPSEEELTKKGISGKLVKCLQQYPQLWAFDHQSTARGVALGLFVAFVPLPGQMMIAALLAYLARANLPFAVGLTWISNPFTFVPLNFAIYTVGKYLTGSRVVYHPLAEFSWDGASFAEIYGHISAWLLSLGKPFLVGVSFLAIFSALLGYVLVYLGFKIKNYFNKTKSSRSHRSSRG